MHSNDVKIITVEPHEGGTRLDKFLTVRLPEFSRSRLQSLIEGGQLTLQGVIIHDSSSKVKTGQEFHLTIPEPTVSHMLPQNIALDVVYEDEDLLVINKQAGLTVHPAPGHPDNTLVNALLAHCGESLSGIGGVSRPGIVHRIDKDTSGLMVVAKHDAAHNALSEQLATRTLTRIYQAVCWGVPVPAAGTIRGNIGRSFSNRQKMAVVKAGGKEAATHYKLITNYQLPITSLIECKLETGRTHQIRVHMTHIGHPLLGDPVYGQPTENRLKSAAAKALSPEARATIMNFKRQALHAKQMRFIHPTTNKEMAFEAPLPDDMVALIKALQ